MEELIIELPSESSTVEGLMREHLESARSYLLSSMVGEYGLCLKLARDLLPDLENDALKERIAAFVESQSSAE